MFPQQVLNDLNRGKQYYSDLNEGFISDLKRGCDNCTPKQGSCLMRILTSLEFKSTGVYDDESQGLYNQMMEIIGGESYVPDLLIIYYGTSASGSPLNLSTILAGVQLPYMLGDSIVVPFSNSAFLYNWVALPNAIVVPNHYQDINNPFIQGGIGVNPDDLFRAAYTVSTFNVITTDYAVPINSPYLLKNE